jgi:cystathionine beta-lyase
VSDDFPYALPADQLRHSESFKWATYADDVLPLWVADMDFAVAPSILTKLHARLEQPIGYHPLKLQSDFTALLRAKFESTGIVGLPERGWVRFLGNVVSGLYASVMALSAPGDEVITFTPIYPPFLSAITDNGCIAKHVAMEPIDGLWRVDFAKLEAAISPSTRVILFCNPHNPTGRVWTREELEKLADIAQRHRLWVITDELHADLTLEGEFVPFAAVASDEQRQRTLTVTGPCKAYNTAGLGIGAMISHNADLVHRVFRKTVGISPQPSALAVTMWQAALEDDGQWLAGVLKQLRSNRDFVAGFVATRLSGVTYFPPQATYLAWLDYRQHPKAGTGSAGIQSYLLKTAKVALNNGRDFGPGFDGFVRLNYATSRAILTEALERLAAAHAPGDA